MKYVKTMALLYMFVITIGYLISSFINLTIDFTKWDESARVTLVSVVHLVFIISCFITFGIMSGSKENAGSK